MDIPNDVDNVELLKELAIFISTETKYPNLVRLFKYRLGKQKI